jgi:hypothetical protein
LKSRKVRWKSHTQCIREKEMHTGVWWGNLQQTDRFEDLGAEREENKVDLKWDGMAWTGLIWLGTGTSGEHLLRR